MAGPRITAVVLAAGLSRRMGDRDKLLLPWEGKPLMAHTLELVAAVPFHQRLLVTTAPRMDAVCVPHSITPIVNEAPELGQSGSLRLGVERATGDAYLFLTADQPLLDRDTLDWLLDFADRDRIVYPTVEGVPRSPTLFPARFRRELLALRGDTGGRQIRRAHPQCCLPLEAPHSRPFFDVDDSADYQWLLDNLQH